MTKYPVPYDGAFSRPTAATREMIILARQELPLEDRYNVNAILRKTVEIADKRYSGESFTNHLSRMRINNVSDFKKKIEYFLIYEDNMKK